MPAFEFTTPVRFADVDHAGIVYYPRYFHLFHLAFEEFWRARLGARAYVKLLDDDKLGFPAVRAECNYRGPLRFGDTAVVAMRVTKLGKTSVHFGYTVSRLEDDGARTLCAEGVVVTAVVNLATFMAVTPTPAIAALLAELE